jgi:hypothetical protein
LKLAALLTLPSCPFLISPTSLGTASAVIATTSDKENIKPSPTQQPTNLSNDNDLADYLKGICWGDDAFEETWQLDITATSVDSQVPVQQWCEDDALLYWFEEFDKLRKDKSVVEAFQCIQQSETIHPLLRGFVNNDDEWEYFIDILKMIHRADGKYKFLPVYVGKCAVRDANGGYDLSCGGGRCKGCMSSQYVDAFRNCASVDMLLTLHHAISSMTDGVFSAEEMLVPAEVVNGRPRCPLPPRPSKSASKDKQYYCKDVAGYYYRDNGSPYQGSKLPVHYCPDIRAELVGKLAHELDCMPMFINVAGTSGKTVMSKLDNALLNLTVQEKNKEPKSHNNWMD